MSEHAAPNPIPPLTERQRTINANALLTPCHFRPTPLVDLSTFFLPRNYVPYTGIDVCPPVKVKKETAAAEAPAEAEPGTTSTTPGAEQTGQADESGRVADESGEADGHGKMDQLGAIQALIQATVHFGGPRFLTALHSSVYESISGWYADPQAAQYDFSRRGGRDHFLVTLLTVVKIMVSYQGPVAFRVPSALLRALYSARPTLKDTSSFGAIWDAFVAVLSNAGCIPFTAITVEVPAPRKTSTETVIDLNAQVKEKLASDTDFVAVRVRTKHGKNGLQRPTIRNWTTLNSGHADYHLRSVVKYMGETSENGTYVALVWNPHGNKGDGLWHTLHGPRVYNGLSGHALDANHSIELYTYVKATAAAAGPTASTQSAPAQPAPAQPAPAQPAPAQPAPAQPAPAQPAPARPAAARPAAARPAPAQPAPVQPAPVQHALNPNPQNGPSSRAMDIGRLLALDDQAVRPAIEQPGAVDAMDVDSSSDTRSGGDSDHGAQSISLGTLSVLVDALINTQDSSSDDSDEDGGQDEQGEPGAQAAQDVPPVTAATVAAPDCPPKRVVVDECDKGDRDVLAGAAAAAKNPFPPAESLAPSATVVQVKALPIRSRQRQIEPVYALPLVAVTFPFRPLSERDAKQVLKALADFALLMYMCNQSESKRRRRARQVATVKVHVEQTMMQGPPNQVPSSVQTSASVPTAAEREAGRATRRERKKAQRDLEKLASRVAASKSVTIDSSQRSSR